MGDSIQRGDSIESSGFPLGFKVAQGTARPGVIGAAACKDVFRTELRAMGGHQKEAVVSEGAQGSSFRAVSDEGPGLNGTDFAPNPLSFYSAALPADVLSRFMQLARAGGILIEAATTEQVCVYAFQGSFMRGDGKGSAEAPKIKLKLTSGAPRATLVALARAALFASPLTAMCREPLDNTFALYANGKRCTFASPTPSSAADAEDPFKVWTKAPSPLEPSKDLPGIVAKLATVTPPAATATPAPTGAQADPMVPERREIRVPGTSRWANDQTESEIISATARWGFKSDERAQADQAPSALAIGAWGVAFCLTTQFLRYADFHKMKIRAVRLVQESPFETQGSAANGDLRAIAHPMDTHIFLHGDESVERMEKLLVMAQNTCYLHALLAGRLEPVVELELNGVALAV
ncbi:MAG: hypothetical protein ACKVQK_25075 [Burkholderiales bacterium]